MGKWDKRVSVWGVAFLVVLLLAGQYHLMKDRSELQTQLRWQEELLQQRMDRLEQKVEALPTKLSSRFSQTETHFAYVNGELEATAILFPKDDLRQWQAKVCLKTAEEVFQEGEALFADGSFNVSVKLPLTEIVTGNVSLTGPDGAQYQEELSPNWTAETLGTLSCVASFSGEDNRFLQLFCYDSAGVDGPMAESLELIKTVTVLVYDPGRDQELARLTAESSDWDWRKNWSWSDEMTGGKGYRIDLSQVKAEPGREIAVQISFQLPGGITYFNYMDGLFTMDRTGRVTPRSEGGGIMSYELKNEKKTENDP